MLLQDIISTINKNVEEFEYSIARKFIEENIGVLNENKTLLKGNARELLDFISNRKDSGLEQLTRKDLMVINAINSSATKFDLRGLKNIIKDHPKLLLRKDVLDYLNSDAKVILEGMKVINNK